MEKAGQVIVYLHNQPAPFVRHVYSTVCLSLQANALFGILGFGGGMDFDSDKAYRCSGCFYRE